MSDVQDLIRAIALDRAYQIADRTCGACGLPAVRRWAARSDCNLSGEDHVFACGACAPSLPTGFEELYDTPTVLTVPSLASFGMLEAGVLRTFAYVRVQSTEQFFAFAVEDDTPPDGLTVFAMKGEQGRWYLLLPRVWIEASLPNRRAVERLMRIARAES